MLRCAIGMRRIAGPVLERAVKCADLRESQKKSNLANGKALFGQVTQREFASRFAQNTAKIRSFLL